MTEPELLAELEALGIDKDHHKLVLLLPLVQVAWADGAIQPAEDQLIRAVAKRYGLVDGVSESVLSGWLSKAPSFEDQIRARRLIVSLVHRMRGLGSDLDLDHLDKLESLCNAVARSAGGLLGLIFTLDKREKDAIREITEGLQLEANGALQNLPTPNAQGSGWRTLQMELSTMYMDSED